MKTFVTLWTIVFLAFIAVMCTVDISNYIPSVYTVFSKNRPLVTGALSILLISVFIWLMVSLYLLKKYSVKVEKLSLGWIGPYISIHFLSLNPLLVRRRRYSRGERYPSALCGCHSL